MEIKTLKNESNELHHKLTQRNDYKMTDMVAYLRDQDLTPASFETIRNHLLKEAVRAQDNGRAIETIFGYEYREYVDAEIRKVPPATLEEDRYGAVRLWGMALIVLTAVSIGYDLINDAIARLYDKVPTGLWTFSVTDLAFVLMLLGVSVTLSAHFTRYRLLHDPDFFSKASNRLGSFIKSYGLTLLILLAGILLIVFMGDRQLLALPYLTAGILLAGLVIAWIVVLRILKNRANITR